MGILDRMQMRRSTAKLQSTPRPPLSFDTYVAWAVVIGVWSLIIGVCLLIGTLS